MGMGAMTFALTVEQSLPASVPGRTSVTPQASTRTNPTACRDAMPPIGLILLHGAFANATHLRGTSHFGQVATFRSLGSWILRYPRFDVRDLSLSQLHRAASSRRGICRSV